MKKINPLFISGCLLFTVPAMSATLSGTLAPTVVPLTNGGQANIAVSNTDPNLFTVPGDRITAINSLDGGLTNQEQTDSGGAILATVSKKPYSEKLVRRVSEFLKYREAETDEISASGTALPTAHTERREDEK